MQIEQRNTLAMLSQYQLRQHTNRLVHRSEHLSGISAPARVAEGPAVQPGSSIAADPSMVSSNNIVRNHRQNMAILEEPGAED